MPLTDTRLRALKPKDKPYKVTDERGLYVEVTPTGSKLWRFRYRIGGAQKKLCIGSYPDISLKQARDAAYEARRAVASGGDPAFEKRKRKIRAEFLSAQTFEAVAREYIEQMMVQNGREQLTYNPDEEGAGGAENFDTLGQFLALGRILAIEIDRARRWFRPQRFQPCAMNRSDASVTPTPIATVRPR